MAEGVVQWTLDMRAASYILQTLEAQPYREVGQMIPQLVSQTQASISAAKNQEEK